VGVILPEAVIGRYSGFGVDTQGFSLKFEPIHSNGAM